MIHRFSPSRLTEDPVIATVDSRNPIAAAASISRGNPSSLASASCSRSPPPMTAAAIPAITSMMSPMPVLNR